MNINREQGEREQKYFKHDIKREKFRSSKNGYWNNH